MRNLSIACIGILLLLGSCKKEPKHEAVSEPELSQEISFYTPDSIQIFGDLYELDKQGKTILLFHQGGSNARGEYEPIIPKLIEKGYNILAIDQRVGGQFYGSYNRTLANIPTNGFGDGYGYCDAYNNLESALDFIIDSGFTGDKIVWGSSYSASLGIQLANNRQQDISGVLAFSPASGNSLKDCLPNEYFETIKIPLLLFRPPHEMERETSKLQSELAKTHGHQTFVPQHGVHGSSMLVASRVGSNVDETWKAVFSFLQKI
ncbi:alpha/beta hydrolase [Flagellimonas flava]|uniref:alpha/beta hydrolase n=1 Tax=Flagellimonas flava TaxID=570519 RepID=UPI003D64CFDC